MQPIIRDVRSKKKTLLISQIYKMDKVIELTGVETIHGFYADHPRAVNVL